MQSPLFLSRLIQCSWWPQVCWCSHFCHSGGVWSVHGLLVVSHSFHRRSVSVLLIKFWCCNCCWSLIWMIFWAGFSFGLGLVCFWGGHLKEQNTEGLELCSEEYSQVVTRSCGYTGDEHPAPECIAAVLQASQKQLENTVANMLTICPRFRGFKNTEDLVWGSGWVRGGDNSCSFTCLGGEKNRLLSVPQDR